MKVARRAASLRAGACGEWLARVLVDAKVAVFVEITLNKPIFDLDKDGMALVEGVHGKAPCMVASG
jgi:hypothetical protein